MSFFGILNLLWNWSRTIFGSIFVFCVLVSLGLLIAELIYYRGKKAACSDKRPEETAGDGRREAAENAAETWQTAVGTFEVKGMRKRIALITGASSGLGRTFAHAIDKTEENIDEIWLVARRRERLMEVAQELDTPSRIFALDLCESESMDVLERALAGEQDKSGDLQNNIGKYQAREEMAVAKKKASGQPQRIELEGTNAESAGRQSVQVGIFVNCAGFAKIGNYAKISRRDSDRMMELNCRAAVDTTLAALPYMRAGDRIIEICSTAAFQPIQHMNLYAASKAFLYNYTRALRMELLPRGILVTAVCPWWIKDTEFISVASDNAQNPDVKSAIRAFPLASTEENVVKRALRASRAGFAVSTPGVMCFFHRIFAKVIPRKWLLYFWELFRRIG